MRISANKNTVRTTIYLNKVVKNKIDELTKKNLIKNQTVFINDALQNLVLEFEKKVALENLIKKIRKIKPVKASKSSVEMIRELRSGREKYLAERHQKAKK